MSLDQIIVIAIGTYPTHVPPGGVRGVLGARGVRGFSQERGKLVVR